MSKLTPANLLTFAQTVEGQTLSTLHRGKPFVISVDGDLLLIEASTGKRPRRVYRDGGLAKVCSKYSLTKSFSPGDYTTESFHASYILTLIDLFLRDGR